MIVIDECSMIPASMVREFDKYIEIYPIKIIFLGDKAQLPPVGEKKSLIFNKVPEDYVYHIILDDIMRTKSKAIKQVSVIIRNWKGDNSLAKELLPIHNKKTSTNAPKAFQLYHKRPDHLNATWFKNFITKLNANKTPIILTWTNKTSDRYNRIIRQHIHESDDLNNYQVGDCAMFNNYYLSKMSNTNFYTSDMIKILAVNTIKKRLFDWSKIAIESPKTVIDKGFNLALKIIIKTKNKFRIDVLSVERIYSDIQILAIGETQAIKTIHRDDLEGYQTMIKNVQRHIELFYYKYKSDRHVSHLWDIFHKKLIDPYAEINFGYSITVYKSQGSTFNTVMVDIDDIVNNTNISHFRKAIYTASTRCSSELGLLVS